MKRIFSVLCVAGSASLLSLAGSTSWAQSTGAAPTRPDPEGFEPIFDELGTDTGATQTGLPAKPAADPRPSPPPVPPRKPEEVHVPPKPIGTVPQPAPPVPPRTPEKIHVPPKPVGEPPPLGDPYQWRWYEEHGGDTKTNPAPPNPAPLPGPDDILDELGDDIGATKTGLPPRPVQPPPEEAPPPDNSAGSQGPRSSGTPPPKAAPPYEDEDEGEEPPPSVPPSFYLPRLSFQHLQLLFPLTAALDAAIEACDPAAFKAAKNRLLEKIGQLLSQSPNDPALLAERRRIEETQLPRPCPPDGR